MNDQSPPDLHTDDAVQPVPGWWRPLIVGLLLTGLVHIGSAVYSWQTEPTDAEQEAAIESILPEGIEIVRFRNGGFVDKRYADLIMAESGPFAEVDSPPVDEVMEHAVSLSWDRVSFGHVRKGEVLLS